MRTNIAGGNGCFCRLVPCNNYSFRSEGQANGQALHFAFEINFDCARVKRKACPRACDPGRFPAHTPQKYAQTGGAGMEMLAVTFAVTPARRGHA